MTNERPLCVYHGNCLDGFTAAWAVRKFFYGEVDFFAGVYGEPPPDVTGRDVIVTDFSYKLPVIEEMAKQCRSLLILDHHATAAADLAGLPHEHVDWFAHVDAAERTGTDGHWINRVGVKFQQQHSGAVLAWEYFHNTPVPTFVRHIEDRDLWKFRLYDTREITAVAASHPYDFGVWDRLVERCEDTAERAAMVIEGEALMRQHSKMIAELLPLTSRIMVIGGYPVPVANMPHIFASDAAGQMAETAPFAAIFWDDAAYRNFSLRSRGPGAMDVSEIAKRYGGGGHRNAAGFRVPLDDLVKEGLL